MNLGHSVVICERKNRELERSQVTTGFKVKESREKSRRQRAMSRSARFGKKERENNRKRSNSRLKQESGIEGQKEMRERDIC